MIPGSQRLLRLRWRPLHRLRRSPRRRPCGERDARSAQGCRDPGFRRRTAARSTSIFAARSMTFWRGCRTHPARPSRTRTLQPPAPRGPGRPKLGVVAREVTLLPRHWEWLAQQPGGASVALRRLVDEARRANKDKDRIRQAQEAAYRFIAAMGGEQAALRRSGARAVRRRCRAFRGMDGGLARRCARSRRRLAAAAFERPTSPDGVAG